MDHRAHAQNKSVNVKEQRALSDMIQASQSRRDEEHASLKGLGLICAGRIA